jgi:hypothetical protein
MRVEPERRLEGQQFTKLGRNTNSTDCISTINSDKHLPQSSFTDHIFLMTTFCFGVYKVS